MAIYPDKTCLAVGGYQHISIYDITRNNPLALCQIDGAARNTVAIGFQNKGSWMYTAGEDKILRIWDMRGHTINCVQSFSHIQPITCVALHPNQVFCILIVFH